MSDLSFPIRAATEIAVRHGITPDRCDILQNGNTLVLRLSESLVARVLTDRDGPRQGTQWYEREIATAEYLARQGAPVIPVHSDIPPGPHQHLGYILNFWQYVTPVEIPPQPGEIGRTLFRCHELLHPFTLPSDSLAILTETETLLDSLLHKGKFSPDIIALLRDHLATSTEVLRHFPSQPLHGDAHPGNLLNTQQGLLWTDWEDTFRGPVEWDLASVIWNFRILDRDHETANAVLDSYQSAGGQIHEEALHHALIARAVVMSAWYPILYPDASKERQRKLEFRLAWLQAIR